MCGSNSRHRRILLGLLVLCLLRTPSISLAKEPWKDPIPIMKEFLLAFYPELEGQHLIMTVSADGPLDVSGSFYTFSVEVGRTSKTSPQVRLLPPEMREPIHVGLFLFDPADGRVWKFTTGSELVNANKNEALRNSVEAHPEWPDEQVVQALKDAGARYGPNDKDAFVQMIPLNKLEKFFGKLRIKSVEFKLRYPQREEPPLAELYWSVHLDGRGPRGRRATYHLTFEPFEGKLTSLWRLPED